MTKYHSTFRQQNGEPFPPKFVNAKIRNGVLRTYYRGPHVEKAVTLTGARLLRMVPSAEQPTWIIEATQKWWNDYWALKAGKPSQVEDGAEPVVESGGLVPGSWDALMMHYKAHNTGWAEMKPKTQGGYLIYHDYISKKIGSHKVEKTTFNHVEALINKKRTEKNGAAVMLHRTLGLLFEHARLSLKWVSVNPVRDLKKPKSKNKDGHHTWVETEVAAWREVFPYANEDGTPCIPRRFLEMEIALGGASERFAATRLEEHRGRRHQLPAREDAHQYRQDGSPRRDRPQRQQRRASGGRAGAVCEERYLLFPAAAAWV